MGMPIKSQLVPTPDGVSSAGCALIEAPQPAVVSPGFQLHVLLVEPAHDEREMYAEHLREHGMRVTCAVNLVQAFDLAGSDRPHVVVIEPCWRHSTDLGLALIRALRADTRTRAIPIVAVSGHAFSHERAAALEAGCESFFQKPCAPASLGFELESAVVAIPAEALARAPTRLVGPTFESGVRQIIRGAGSNTTRPGPACPCRRGWTYRAGRPTWRADAVHDRVWNVVGVIGGQGLLARESRDGGPMSAPRTAGDRALARCC